MKRVKILISRTVKSNINEYKRNEERNTFVKIRREENRKFVIVFCFLQNVPMQHMQKGDNAEFPTGSLAVAIDLSVNRDNGGVALEERER